MPQKQYLVTLSEAEREHLEQLLRGGTTATRQLTRARILRKAAEGWTDERIAEALAVGRATIECTRRRFVEGNLEALQERPGQRPKLDEKAQARLIAEACNAAPEGHQHWTLQLLADRIVALGLAEFYSYESVRRLLKKTRSSRG